MLLDIVRRLDDWIVARNVENLAEGLLPLRPCEIKLVGQAALLHAQADLTLVATEDVDVYADYEFVVERQFRRLLAARGLVLDPMGHQIWMPPETQYAEAFAGQYVRLLVADAEAVLLSKALKAPQKNQTLIVEYLARGASQRFLDLAKKYRLDLEQFL